MFGNHGQYKNQHIIWTLTLINILAESGSLKQTVLFYYQYFEHYFSVYSMKLTWTPLWFATKQFDWTASQTHKKCKHSKGLTQTSVKKQWQWCVLQVSWFYMSTCKLNIVLLAVITWCRQSSLINIPNNRNRHLGLSKNVLIILPIGMNRKTAKKLVSWVIFWFTEWHLKNFTWFDRWKNLLNARSSIHILRIKNNSTDPIFCRFPVQTYRNYRLDDLWVLWKKKHVFWNTLPDIIH